MDGLENVPATGPAMLVCNHVSYLDPVYTAVFVHRARRTPRFLAKDSLWKVPVFGRIMAGSRQIPVSRGSRDAGASLAAAHRAFDDDGVVVIYPEGTITRDPAQWPMQARTGIARLVLDCPDVPVVPIGQWGAQHRHDLPRSRAVLRLLRRPRIDGCVGEPLDLARFRGAAADAETLREITDVVMSAIRDQVAELRGLSAPPAFFLPPVRLVDEPGRRERRAG
jgi:1-acyl-sn-glycerol-3-phosphate acyltransferase